GQLLKSILASIVALFLAASLSGPALAETKPAPTPVDSEQLKKIDEAAKAAQSSADTAWMLISTGLVLLMVPGLALFYGGMVRRKNILGTMMHSMVALALIGIQWILFGYSLTFGETHGGYWGWSNDFLGLTG